MKIENFEATYVEECVSEHILGKGPNGWFFNAEVMHNYEMTYPRRNKPILRLSIEFSSIRIRTLVASLRILGPDEANQRNIPDPKDQRREKGNRISFTMSPTNNSTIPS